jgi:pyruvate formate lyase activating enzyme
MFKYFSCLGTIGCNLRCDFCQNWNISQLEHAAPGSKSGDIEDSAFGYYISPEQIDALCDKHNFTSVAFTYNEPSFIIFFFLLKYY